MIATYPNSKNQHVLIVQDFSVVDLSGVLVLAPSTLRHVHLILNITNTLNIVVLQQIPKL